MNATAPIAVDAIAANIGDKSFAFQAARRLRESGKLPTKWGNIAAPISSEQLALLITAAALGPGVQVAVDRALSLPLALLAYLTALVDKSWDAPHDPIFDFGSVRIDMSTGSSVIVELSDGELVTKSYGAPPSNNPVSRTLSFATIRDVVQKIRSSRTRRVRS